MKCARCLALEKEWPAEGKMSNVTFTRGEIACAFAPEAKSESIFTAENWNCGTMIALRDAIGDGAVYREDEWAGLLFFDHTDDELDMSIGGVLTIRWYKSRGRTTAAGVLWDTWPNAPAKYGPCMPLTLELAEEILGRPH